MSKLNLYVNSKIYSGWESVRISRAMDACAGSFDLETFDRWEPDMDPWDIFTGDSVVLKIDDKTIISGYVDTTNVRIEASERSFSVSGRDKTADIVDCSAVNKPGEWKNKTILDIAKDLCKPYGVSVKTDIIFKTPQKVFRIQPGETVFESLERLAKGSGVLISSDTDGNLFLSRQSNTRISQSLVEGENILSCEFQDSTEDRFNKYIILGQGDGSDKKSHTISATKTDPVIKRARAIIITADSSATLGYAERRAQWESRMRAAKGQSVSITVQGWKTSDGVLWMPNQLVLVQVPSCRLNCEMLISTVEYSKDSSGEITTLQLCRGDAYLDEPELPEDNEPVKAHKAGKKSKKKKKKKDTKKAAKIIEKDLMKFIKKDLAL